MVAGVLRLATEGDLELLAVLDEMARVDPDRRAQLARASQDGQLWVLCADGAVVGYGQLSDRFFQRPFIELVWVAEAQRGLGYGARIIAHLESVCGRSRLFTSTNRSNGHMLHVLAKLGYRQCGIVHDLDPGDPELIFSKRLPGETGDSHAGPTIWLDPSDRESAMALENAPAAIAQMLIRRPPAEVFQAVVDPAVTSRFWFTRGSGPLHAGTTVRWDWDMYGASATVSVEAVEPDRRILVRWGDPPRPLEFSFEPRDGGSTLVRVCDSGFTGSDDEVVAQALDSMGGFSSMLAGMKAWLEHGVALGLVADHHPDAHVAGD